MFFSAIDANTARAIAEAVNDRLTEKNHRRAAVSSPKPPRRP
ncbi:hypothetical protein [Actinomyces sp. Z5]|nr:hypothetical protein [Actinomyces sp. Z5]